MVIMLLLDDSDDFPGSASNKKGSSGGIGKNELDSMIQSLKRKQALSDAKEKVITKSVSRAIFNEIGVSICFVS